MDKQRRILCDIAQGCLDEWKEFLGKKKKEFLDELSRKREAQKKGRKAKDAGETTQQKDDGVTFSDKEARPKPDPKIKPVSRSDPGKEEAETVEREVVRAPSGGPLKKEALKKQNGQPLDTAKEKAIRTFPDKAVEEKISLNNESTLHTQGLTSCSSLHTEKLSSSITTPPPSDAAEDHKKEKKEKEKAKQEATESPVHAPSLKSMRAAARMGKKELHRSREDEDKPQPSPNSANSFERELKKWIEKNKDEDEGDTSIIITHEHRPPHEVESAKLPEKTESSEYRSAVPDTTSRGGQKKEAPDSGTKKKEINQALGKHEKDTGEKEKTEEKNNSESPCQNTSEVKPRSESSDSQPSMQPKTPRPSEESFEYILPSREDLAKGMKRVEMFRKKMQKEQSSSATETPELPARKESREESGSKKVEDKEKEEKTGTANNASDGPKNQTEQTGCAKQRPRDRPNQSFAGMKPEELKEKTAELNKLLKSIKLQKNPVVPHQESQKVQPQAESPQDAAGVSSAGVSKEPVRFTKEQRKENKGAGKGKKDVESAQQAQNEAALKPFTPVIESSDDDIRDDRFSKKKWVDSPSLPRKILMQSESQADMIFGSSTNAKVNLKEMFKGIPNLPPDSPSKFSPRK